MPTPQLPTISKLLSSAWEHARPKYWKLAGVVLLGILLLLPLNLLYFFDPDFGSPTVPMESPGRSLLTLLLIVTFSVFVQFWMRLALNRTIIQPKKLGVFRSYKESLKILPSFLWMYFLQMLITIPAFLLFMVPAFILFINVWFAGWFVTTEEAKGLNALAKSRELSRGIFWKTAGRCLFPALLVMAFTLTMNFYLPLNPIWSEEFTKILLNIINPIFSIVAMPLIVQYDYELFLALKKRASKKDPQKQVEKYQIFTIIGATLLTLYVLIIVLTFSLLSLVPESQSIPQTAEKLSTVIQH